MDIFSGNVCELLNFIAKVLNKKPVLSKLISEFDNFIVRNVNCQTYLCKYIYLFLIRIFLIIFVTIIENITLTKIYLKKYF